MPGPTVDLRFTQDPTFQGTVDLITGGMGPQKPVASQGEVFSRFLAAANLAALTSGTLRLQAIALPQGITINSVTFFSATTALGTGTHQWFGLFDNNQVALGFTADATNAAWAANSAKTLALSTAFTTTYSGLYYLGIMVAATTVPTLLGYTSLAQVAALAPALNGNTSNTGLTGLPTLPFTAGTLTADANNLYAYVS